MPEKRVFMSIATILVASVLLTGCKAQPAKPAGFAEGPGMKHDPNLPFHRFYQSPKFVSSKYKKIYVAPVNTSYMISITDWQKGERKDDIQKDIAKLATFTQDKIKKTFTDDKEHRFAVVDSPSTAGDGLTIETALIEVVPSKVTLNALGYAPFFIGTGITLARAAAQDHSSAAFEARLKDSQTGEPVMLIADRESEQTALVTVRGLTWYSHAETIITQWSEQMLQVLKRKGNEKVKDTDPFTLQPW